MSTWQFIVLMCVLLWIGESISGSLRRILDALELGNERFKDWRDGPFDLLRRDVQKHTYARARPDDEYG